MTIAISVKVDDGLVLAADSAATMTLTGQSGQRLPVNTYNNARKVFHLHDTRPVGAISWGTGAIDRFSVGRLVKGFRARTKAINRESSDNDCYTVEGMATDFMAFLKEYSPATIEKIDLPEFFIAGYSAGSDFSEAWRIEIGGGPDDLPSLVHSKENTGMNFFGMPLSLERLIYGYDPKLTMILDQAGVAAETKEAILGMCEHDVPRIICEPSMPIQDAIDLAQFLADTAINFTRFCWGPNSVAGPIDIAVITQYEGFKWVSRKLFFDKALND